MDDPFTTHHLDSSCRPLLLKIQRGRDVLYLCNAATQYLHILFDKCPKVHLFFIYMYRFVVEQSKEVELGVNLITYQVQNDNELHHPAILVMILSTHGLAAFHFQLLLFSAWIQVMLINQCLH